MSHKILRVDASMRINGSVSRQLTDKVIEKLGGEVTVRDLAAEAVPFVSETWIGANFTDEAERSDEQREAIALSDRLIAEVEAADTIVIGAPVYNFGIPAALKAWIDQIARARKTFRYTDNGVEGLLKGKKVYVLMATGGTKVGSEIDFASGYLQFVLGFLGLDDVTIIAADQLMKQGDAAIEAALQQVDQLAA